MEVDEVTLLAQDPIFYPPLTRALRPPQPRSNKRRPAHIRPLSAVQGCGRKTLDKLAIKFPTAEDLNAASEEDFLEMDKVGAPLARKLFRFCQDGTTPAAEPRVPMWNTVKRTKISGAAAPLESKVDAWLASRRGAFYEKYTGQDLKQRGPRSVPEDDMIDESELKAFYLAHKGPTDLGDAHQKICGLLQPYDLKPLDQSSKGRVTGCLPGRGSAQFALLHAAASLDVDVLSLHKALDVAGRAPEVTPPEGTLLKLLATAHTIIKRPIWLFTCSPGAAGSSSSDSADVKVFMQEEDDDDEPEHVAPIRIALLGDQFLALVELDRADVVDVIVPDDAMEHEHAELPDLRADVERSLDDARAQIDKVEQVFTTGAASYDLSAARESIDSLRERLTSGKGKEAAFLGANNVGKSTVICSLVLNSSVDAATYKHQPDDYVPEALRNALSGQEALPTYQELLSDSSSLGDPKIEISVLQPDGNLEAAAKAAAEQYKAMENSIKSFCEKGGDKPQLTNFVLPCGDGGGSTTALHTYVRYGTVVQLLVEYYSVDDLKRSAFNVHPTLEPASRPTLSSHLARSLSLTPCPCSLLSSLSSCGTTRAPTCGA